MKNAVYIGTSGFYYGDWVGKFYPPDLPKDKWLSFYADEFSTLEVNSTFYHIPYTKTVQNRQAKVPANFIFCIKASKILTHTQKGVPDQELVTNIFTPLLSLISSPPQHLVLFQYPHSVQVNNESLAAMLAMLPPWFLYACEFRHQSWFTSETYAILRKYNVALVLADSPLYSSGRRMRPLVDVDTASFSYIRLHGSQRLYVSSYTDEELQHYARLVQQKIAEWKNVYIYFNNTSRCTAVADARRLRKLLFH